MRVTAQVGTQTATVDYDIRTTDPLADRFLVGAGCEGSSYQISSLETQAVAGARRDYYQLGDLSQALADARADHAMGRMPVYTVKVQKSDDKNLTAAWNACASGARDADLIGWRDAFAALGFWCSLGLHHEPENDIGDNVPIDPWVAMQQHAGPLFHQAPNILFTGCYTGYPQVFNNNAQVQTTGLSYSLDKVWPGDGIFDLVLIDPYLSFGMYPDGWQIGSRSTKWTNMAPYYDTFEAWVAGHQGSDRPLHWGVAETGISTYAYNNPPAGKNPRTWMAEQIGAVKAHPHARIWLYYNSMFNSRGEWYVDDCPNKLTDLRAVMPMGV